MAPPSRRAFAAILRSALPGKRRRLSPKAAESAALGLDRSCRDRTAWLRRSDDICRHGRGIIRFQRSAAATPALLPLAWRGLPGLPGRGSAAREDDVAPFGRDFGFRNIETVFLRLFLQLVRGSGGGGGGGPRPRRLVLKDRGLSTSFRRSEEC